MIGGRGHGNDMWSGRRYVSLEQKRIDQTKPFDAKTSAWVPDEQEGFLFVKITGTKGDMVSVTMPSGEVGVPAPEMHMVVARDCFTSVLVQIW